MRWKRVFAVAPLLGVPLGCAPGPLDAYWPEASPLGRDIEAVQVPRNPSGLPQQSAIEEPRGDLDLTTALSLALQHNPDLAAFAWEIRAEEAAVLQAGLLPNPEAEVEVENFGGSGSSSGFDASETTFTIGQTILLGGKRQRRVDLARVNRDLAGWDYEVARVGVITTVAFSFVNTLAAQKRLEFALETVALAERLHTAIGERVLAGKISPVERTKARGDLGQARLELLRAERALTIARHRLAAMWADVVPTFEMVTGDLSQIRTPPSMDALVRRIEDNPDLARWTTEMNLRSAAIALARAERVPDLTLSGGARLLDGADETAFVAGVAMPIPIFDRNQGGILESRLRGAQAEQLRRAAQIRVQTDLAVAHQELHAAYNGVLIVQSEIEPSARSALEAAEEAFRYGKIGALDLLDAQRTLSAARRQFVEVQAAYLQTVIVVERLIGGPLHELEQ